MRRIGSSRTTFEPGFHSRLIVATVPGCTSIRSNFDQGNIYRDNFWEVWSSRYEPFRDRSWARRDECADCRMFRYCQGGGMHLRDDEGRLLMCHYKRL